MKKTLFGVSAKYFKLLFISIVSVQVADAQQTKFSMQSAIEYGISHNLSLKRSEIAEKISDHEVRRSKLDRYPDLFARASGQLNVGRSLDFTTYSYVNEKTLLSSEDLISNFTIFQGFQKTNQIRENKYNLEANKSNTQRIRNDLTINIVALYLKVLSLKSQLVVIMQQDTLFGKQLDFTVKNFEMGKKLAMDVSNAKFQIAKSQLNITSKQNELNNTILDLKRLLNMDTGQVLDFEEPKDFLPGLNSRVISDIYKTAVNFYPQVKQAEYNKLAAMKQIDIVKGSFYPRLNLTANVTSNYSRRLQNTLVNLNPPFFTQFRDNLYQYVSLNLSIPIFNKLNSRISLDQARLKLEEIEIQEKEVKNDLYQIVHKATGDLEASKKAHKFSQEAFHAAKETFEVIQQKYKMGTASSLDLNLAQNEMNRAHLESIQAKYELIFRDKIIDFYLGKPISY